MSIDLRAEQDATLQRPTLSYSLLARLMFWSMDLFYGKALTLPKIKFLEIIARIPYQAWELRQYWRLITGFADPAARADAEGVIRWSREAQDNEYWHLVVASEKMKQDGVKDSWFWYHLVPPIVAFIYTLFSRIVAFVSIKSAWRLNMMFEDHAEHAFMGFARDNPQLENEPVTIDAVQDGRGPNDGAYDTWADVFRRIALDERQHMNESRERYEQLGGDEHWRFVGSFGVWDFLVALCAAAPWGAFAALRAYSSVPTGACLFAMACCGGAILAFEFLRMLFSKSLLDHVPAFAIAGSYIAAWLIQLDGPVLPW